MIILTGYSDLSVRFCNHLGADDYLEKPADAKAIGAILEKYKTLNPKS